MPAGDAQRVWFPEMLDDLRSFWTKETAWERLANFCERMTEKRKRIRLKRGIQPPMMWCPKCGKRTRAGVSNVSIRSALFALKKDGLISEAELKELDKSWMKHKKKNGLDASGRKTEEPRDEGTGQTNTRCHQEGTIHGQL